MTRVMCDPFIVLSRCTQFETHDELKYSYVVVFYPFFIIVSLLSQGESVVITNFVENLRRIEIIIYFFSVFHSCKVYTAMLLNL